MLRRFPEDTQLTSKEPGLGPGSVWLKPRESQQIELAEGVWLQHSESGLDMDRGCESHKANSDGSLSLTSDH